MPERRATVFTGLMLSKPFYCLGRLGTLTRIDLTSHVQEANGKPLQLAFGITLIAASGQDEMLWRLGMRFGAT